ncbi:APC family permease [Spirosoma radiotolerans]|uniref:Arginine/agmatine antiporter n=1 Tax=Spirosoma radiotolerans TaxID=1379870 RepID=A0A0E3ZUI6_9BACT|nr:amino acid permease [Spirosoma radiotolerans]AKD55219.1 amino acid permease-associated protein [Spirosoma radiotolerans]
MADTTSSSPVLLRGIGRYDFIALIINITIGAGILGLPTKLYALAGTWSLLAYGVSAGIVTLIILCFAEVSSRFSGTGGPYLYTRIAFGPLVGFEVGWLFWLSRIAAFASICNLFVSYAALFRPQLATGWERTGLMAALVTSLAILNYIGVQRSARVNTLFTITKLLAVALFAAVGLFFVKSTAFAWPPFPSYASFSQTVLLLIFTFSGFDVATIPSGEVQQPQRTVPLSLLVAIGTVAVLFMAVQIVCIGTLPNLGSSERPLADAARQFIGPAGGWFITIVALLTALGTLHALMLTGPRLLFAMAEQGQLPNWLAATHPRFRTPYSAILITAILQLLLAVTGTFLYALTLSTLIRIAYFALTCAALPVFRRRANVPPAQFRVAGGWLISALAVVLCLWLLSNSSGREARDVAIAMAAGLVIFGLMNRRQRRDN